MDLSALIVTVGYLGLLAIIFAESGLLIGFFLPGDSLLFTAGLLASQGWLNIWLLAGGTFVAAVAGDSVGYAFGRRVGPRLFRRPESLVFHPEQLVRARTFFERHGAKTIVLARFIPVVRTFAPIVAGVGEMRYPTFLTYNLAGGALWAIGLTLAGYWLGGVIPNVDHYLLPLVAGIIVVSLLPTAFHLFRGAEQRRRILAVVNRLWRSSRN